MSLLNEEAVEQLRVGYVTHSAQELHQSTGISVSVISQLAWKRKWRHDKATEIRLRLRWINGRYTTKRLYNGLTMQELVVRYYPDYSSTEIANMVGDGVTYQSINKAARKYGVAHSEETLARIREKQRKGPKSRPHTDSERSHLSAKASKMLKREKWRLENGMPQVTRRPLSLAPQGVKRMMWNLAKRRHYFCDCRVDSYALFYDDHTIRDSPKYLRKESYYTEKYGIKFLPADGFGEDKGE